MGAGNVPPDFGVTPVPGPLAGSFGPSRPFTLLPPQSAPPTQVVQYDNVGPSSSGQRATSGTLTWTHTANLPNVGIIVCASLDTTVASSTMTATCDGIAMTPLGPSGGLTGGPILNCVMQMWISARGLAKGNHTIVVTPTAGYTDIEGASLSFANYASHDQPAQWTTGTSSAPSLFIPSTPPSGNPVVVFLSGGDVISNPPLYQKFINNTTGFGGNQLGNIEGSVTYPVAGESAAWTLASSATWGAIGVELMAPAPLRIATAASQQAWTGIAFSLTLGALGGFSPYTWSVVSGSLPSWATLTSGVISGTPTGSGSSTFTIQATDAASGTATLVMTIAWEPKPYVAGIGPGSAWNRNWIDQYGNPIMLLGDTAWGLFTNAGSTNGTGTVAGDFTAYCQARSAQGFNAIFTNGLGHTHTGGVFDDGRTWDGVYPFTLNGTPGPFVTGTETVALNNTYWSRLDTFLSTAQTYGITVFPNLSMTNDLNIGTSHGFTTTPWLHASTAQQTAACKLIGQRYASTPNIVLGFFGDDYFNDDDTEMFAIQSGLAQGDPRVLAVAVMENNPSGQTSRWDFSAAPTQPGGANPPLPFGFAVATFNYVYCYMQTYFGIEYAYSEPSPIPVMRGDGFFYSEGPDVPNDDRLSRTTSWWALASGARGVNTGNDLTGHWVAGSLALLTSGEPFYTSGQALNIITSFMALPGWWKLQPDLTSSLVTAGRGTRATYTAVEYTANTDNYVCASLAPDGTLALIYCAAAFSITINQSKLLAGYTGIWIDPASGVTYPATTGSTYNSGAQDGIKPILNSQGGADWVLALMAPSLPTPPYVDTDPGPAQDGSFAPLTQVFGPDSPFAILPGIQQGAVPPSSAIPLTDSGSGTDALTVTPVIPLTDSGTGTDALTVTATVALTDSGTGTDALAVTVPVALTDSGTGTDALAVSIPVALTDAGTGTDALAVALAIALTDSGTGTDALVAVPVVPVTDSGTGTDALTVAVGVALSDTGTGADALTLAPVSIALTDAGAGADVFALVLAIQLADAGAAADTMLVVSRRQATSSPAVAHFATSAPAVTAPAGAAPAVQHQATSSPTVN